MKKILLVLLLLILLGGAVAAWIFLGSGTGFRSVKEVLYIRSNAATKTAVLDSLESNNIISNSTAFNWLAGRLNYWENIRPGKYEIKKGASLLSIIRKLRNGQQTPVDLVITKLRTREDFARFTGKRLEFDSTDMMGFLNSSDSLEKFGVDTSTVFTMILPDTYTYFWNTTPEKVIKKIHAASEKFWTEEKLGKAANQGLDKKSAYILASIVEEETTNNSEKGNVASVYLNRLRRGMPLQADPTVKFAMKDFGLRRIYEKHLAVASPYNTYRNKGLPPGPICTPSRRTIDAVLDAPKTDYLFFVADPTKRETHDFSRTYDEHLKKARVYRQALNRRDSLRASGQ